MNKFLFVNTLRRWRWNLAQNLVLFRHFQELLEGLPCMLVPLCTQKIITGTQWISRQASSALCRRGGVTRLNEPSPFRLHFLVILSLYQSVFGYQSINANYYLLWTYQNVPKGCWKKNCTFENHSYVTVSLTTKLIEAGTYFILKVGPIAPFWVQKHLCTTSGHRDISKPKWDIRYKNC